MKDENEKSAYGHYRYKVSGERKNIPALNYKGVTSTQEAIQDAFKGKMGDLKYRHQPGTIIMVDNNNNPIGVDNGDGTWSGIKADLFINSNSMTETGIWSQKESDLYHQSSPKLARWLAKYLDMDTHVVDFGCGNGFYISELSGVGFRCLGIEGTNMKFLHDNVLVADLTSPLITYMVQQFTFMLGASCICLEVMEHVPKEHEQRLLDTITDSVNSKLILSWAEVGQPGIGHCNCVDQLYAINEIERRGFKFLEKDTQEARKNIDDNCNWFRRTLLVFERV